jgi:hypothetical protein
MKNNGKVYKLGLGLLLAFAGVGIARAGHAGQCAANCTDTPVEKYGSWSQNLGATQSTTINLGVNSSFTYGTASGKASIEFTLGAENNHNHYDGYGDGEAFNGSLSVFCETVQDNTPGTSVYAPGDGSIGTTCNGATYYLAVVDTCTC